MSPAGREVWSLTKRLQSLALLPCKMAGGREGEERGRGGEKGDGETAGDEDSRGRGKRQRQKEKGKGSDRYLERWRGSDIEGGEG